MPSRIWTRTLSVWDSLPKKLTLFLKNLTHQSAHLGILCVDGIKNTIVGHGILSILGKNINELTAENLYADILGTLTVGLVVYTIILGYNTKINHDTLIDRNKWLHHFLWHVLPLSIISFAFSIIGTLYFELGFSETNIEHMTEAGLANLIGSGISICTVLLIMLGFDQFGKIMRRRNTKRALNGNLPIDDSSLLRRLFNNSIREAVNLLILYTIGVLGSVIGLALYYPSGRIGSEPFSKAITGDLIGISFIAGSLGVIYCGINTFAQKQDITKQPDKFNRHTIVRQVPIIFGMPLMTIVGTSVKNKGDDITTPAAANATGILVLSIPLALSVTFINQYYRYRKRKKCNSNHAQAISYTSPNLPPTATPNNTLPCTIINAPIIHSSYNLIRLYPQLITQAYNPQLNNTAPLLPPLPLFPPLQPVYSPKP